MADTFVAGVLSDRQAVREAYRRLRAIGIQRADMSVLLPGHRDSPGQITALQAGAITGVVIGGIVGGLSGIGALVIPVFGIFGGPVLSFFAGAGTGGLVGGTFGWLAGLWIRKSESRLATGVGVLGILLAVYHCDELAKGQVEKILRDCGAQAILPR